MNVERQYRKAENGRMIRMLQDSEVIAIRKAWFDGASAREIAALFALSHGTLINVLARRTHTDIGLEYFVEAARCTRCRALKRIPKELAAIGHLCAGCMQKGSPR